MTPTLKGKRVALIGGAGFIGHNLALTLQAQGAEVHVVDSLQVNNLLHFTSSTSSVPNSEMYLRIIHERMDLLRQKGIALHPVDARYYLELGELLNHKIKPHVIVHLAAVAHAGKSNKNPYSTFDHSLRTLENALDCARGQVEQFIYFSSSMVYGNFETPEVSEDHPLNPLGIYGALKLSGEKIVIAYQQVFDLPYTIIRPSALYGPRCVSRRVGQVFIENALEGKRLLVNGDGLEKLDFTYIQDLVDGVCLTVANPKAINETFNLTYGSSRSIQDLIEVVQREFPDVQVEFQERDKLMPFRGTLSVDKARKKMGYAPAFPIEKGFKKYIEWYREFSEPQAEKAAVSA